MLFEEKEVSLSQGQYESVNLADLAVEDSILFYFDSVSTGASNEYGDFKIFRGASFDAKAKDEKALLASISPISFIPNTLLLNAVENGKFIVGGFYRITKAWNRGDSFTNKNGQKQKAKGYGYKLSEILLSESIKTSFSKELKSKLSGANDLEITEVEKPDL
ncbi:hypothetical protein FBF91_08020 [Campylobacter upsaliensis]|uniref:hypothetical protein n=1 Tax=Campylobacter upsaliensis TaxID=28080 RepID=UPI0012C37DB0|nr:hypothetical protein [Campylobacter upsaliensis]EAK7296943.1 hypothetical protein [Campylobacter upsaliensis]MBJ6809620.1 hypothetical protein [Campylobacter upsaliensis]